MTRTLFVLACIGGAFAQQTDYKPGQTGPFCGVVTSSRVITIPGGACDFRLTLKPPDASTPLEIVIPDATRRQLAARPWDYFHQDICVSGPIQSDRAEPYVLVTKPSQIEVTSKGASLSFGAGAVSACDAALQPPRLLKETKPRYTDSAMRQKIQGVVVMDAVVDADGKVTDARVTRALHPELDEQALLAVKQWQFQPGTRDGKPVSVLVAVEMSFTRR